MSTRHMTFFQVSSNVKSGLLAVQFVLIQCSSQDIFFPLFSFAFPFSQLSLYFCVPFGSMSSNISAYVPPQLTIPKYQYMFTSTNQSNIPAFVPPQLTSPISEASQSDYDLTQSDQSLLETLVTLCGSASASSKFVDGRINGTFVSDYVFNLNLKTLSPLEIKVLEKGLGFSPTSPSINEVDLRRAISDLTGRKILVKHPSLIVVPLGISKRSACTRTVFKPDRSIFYQHCKKRLLIRTCLRRSTLQCVV